MNDLLSEEVTSTLDRCSTDEQTIQKFNRLTVKLQSTQLKLQRELSSLEHELSEVDRQRLQELSKKEVIADRLHYIIEALPSGIIVLDEQGIVELVNQTAIHLLGHPLKGYQWRDIINNLFSPQPDDGHEISLANGKKVRIDTQVAEKSAGQIILITDLTDTRRLQSDVAQHDRLAFLGQMAATLAHQIRTPLSTAQLYLSELPKKIGDIDQFEKNQKKISAKLNLINQQIEDMLIFSKKECLIQDHTDLNVLLEDAVDNVRAQAEHHSVGVELQLFVEPICIRCHYTALLGALVNILVNAIEASVPGQCIYLLGDIDDADKTYKIQIIDYGVGFHSHSPNEIFEPFVSNKKNGTGLGMNVVKWVMETHGYQIDIQSKSDQGSVITVVINQEASQIGVENVDS